MRAWSSTLAFAILAALTATTVHASAVRPEPKTDAAVKEASDDWLAAERRGDTAALDRRLMPEYRDILPDGSVHPRSMLIAHTANLKNPSTVPAKQLAADFRKAHPTGEEVVITGDTAMISYLSLDPQANSAVLAIDIFVYDQGRWRALTSMQSGHH